MRFQPEIFYVEESIAEAVTTRAILKRHPETPVVRIDSFQKAGLQVASLNQKFKGEKRALILARKQGELVKQVQRDLFRPTPNEYYIIHSFGCPFDCQYCFLFDYLDHQIPTVFVNMDEIVERIQDVVHANPDEQLTFHAGEFSDALAFDHITNLSQPLIETFAAFTNATLEMRTKSDNVDALLSARHNARTVISWTFSPQRVAQLFEYQTASARARIAAARRCQDAGYPIALRLDPIIRFPEWESAYRELIAEMAGTLAPNRIVDCHLGVFRYTTGLGNVIRERFSNSWLRLEESVPCADGKHRYLRPQRVDMYRQIIGWLRADFPELTIELCMDSPEVEAEVANSI